MNRRAFIKGMGLVAASALLPTPWGDPTAEAQVLTSGIRLIRFAHLTDLHFTNRPQNRYPTSHFHIKQAVADLNARQLDFVLFTGDMFHFPADMEEEMPVLRNALDGLRHPYYCAIGNHDAEGDGLSKRKRFLGKGIGDRGLAQGSPYYTFSPAPGLRFIVLDSTDVDGNAYHTWTGHLSDRQLRWLAETLARFRGETVFVAIHHPPLTPYPFMDRLKFAAADRHHLADLLARYPNVQLMLAGHYHFGGRNRFGPAELLLGPSLVEHPHPYRVVDVYQIEGTRGAIAYNWQTLNLHTTDDEACATGTASVRSYGLMSLSYQHNGVFPLALPG